MRRPTIDRLHRLRWIPWRKVAEISRQRSALSETEPTHPDVDPDESPFETPPAEGIPYERGSAEDKAVRRVIEESSGDRTPEPDERS